MKVSPQDFYSETPPPRVIGTECEYSLQLMSPSASPTRYISVDAANSAGIAMKGAFLGSEGGGGKLYCDINNIVEYASAEMLGPAGAAVADLEGQKIVSRIITGSGLVHHGLYRFSGTTMPTSGNGMKTETVGYHENYLVDEELLRQEKSLKLLEILVPSVLASRIYSMNGSHTDKGFGFSQKVAGIGGEPVDHRGHRKTVAGTKPMILLPSSHTDRDVTGKGPWARVEVRYADCGQSPVASFAGKAAISLALRLVEHSEIIGESSLKGISFSKPVAAARLFAADKSLSEKAETNSGKHLSALEFQELFISTAHKLSEKIQLPDDEQFAIEVISRMLDVLKIYRDEQDIRAGIAAGFDWAARDAFISRTSSSGESGPLNFQAVQKGLLWDRVLPEGPGILFWEKVAPQHPDFLSVVDFGYKNGMAPRAKERMQHIDSDSSQVVTWAEYGPSGVNLNWFGDVYGD